MRVSCALLLLVLVCAWSACEGQQALQLRFIPQTLRAAWSPRWDSNIEWYPHALTFLDTQNQTRQWTAGRIMILQGDGAARTNDIWASSDQGLSWWLIAGRTWSGIGAGGGRASTSFYPVTGRAATGIDQLQRIYRIAGNLQDGSKSNAVWMTQDGGQTWRNQQTVQGALGFIPNRDRSSVMVDASDALYLIGGEVRGEPGTLNTDSSFKSTDQGITWQLQPSTPWSARSTGLFLNHRSPQLDNREILTYLTGWDGVRLWNEVWISSDLAQTWSRVKTNWGDGLPPWRARDAANGEVTRDGVIILIGGQAVDDGVRETLNDGQGRDSRGEQSTAAAAAVADALLPVSACSRSVGESGRRLHLSVSSSACTAACQAAASTQAECPLLLLACVSLCCWSGGRCNEDATFDDRRDLMTVLDDEGFLYVAGGTDWSRDLTFNDVWRSSFSFNNVTAVGLACGLSTPACGPGLTCWPGDPRTTFYSNGSVTCPASRQCAGVSDAFLDFDVQTAAASWRGRWAANAEVFPKAFAWRDPGNAPRTMPANSLIVQGGQSQNNDVWASTDGRFWDLVAGYAEYASQGGGRDVRAGGTAYLTSFFPPLSEATGIVDHRGGAIYRVGGYGSAGERNDVWRTTNVTVWTKQAAAGLPPRSASNVVVDDRGKLYVVGGVNLGQTLNDVWFSVNNGSSFGRASLSTAPFFMPGRGKGFLLHRYSPFVGKDVLYYGAGWNGVDMYNDLWVSSDEAASWTQVTANAPYAARDAVAAEITDAGLIVLAGGQAGAYTMNDVSGQRTAEPSRAAARPSQSL